MLKIWTNSDHKKILNVGFTLPNDNLIEKLKTNWLFVTNAEEIMEAGEPFLHEPLVKRKQLGLRKNLLQIMPGITFHDLLDHVFLFVNWLGEFRLFTPHVVVQRSLESDYKSRVYSYISTFLSKPKKTSTIF